MQNNEEKNIKKALFWFRNDLRLEDNVALKQALSKYDSVACIYIFEKDFLKNLKKKDLTMDFLYKAISNLKNELRALGSDLIIKLGDHTVEIPNIAKKFGVNAIVTNKLYSPKEVLKEDLIEKKLFYDDISFFSYKDNVIFSPEDLLDEDGNYFSDFSTYRDIWNSTIKNEDIKPVFITNKSKLAKFKSNDMPKLEQFGFITSNLSEKMKVSPSGAWEQFLKFKDKAKRYISVKELVHYSGVSYMSIYLRFGLISVRTMLSAISLLMKELNKEERENVKYWIDQLIRREFNIQYYYYNNNLLIEPEKIYYLSLNWENDMNKFNLWCEGKTGYPIIDAAMRSLKETGYMHFRLRQLTSSFLTKVLFIDYRYGEAFFATSLLDYDEISNNVGWQWAASVNNDKNEYIKMYNPSENSKRFDTNAHFIKKYIPELSKIPSKYLHEPWNYENELKKLGVSLGEDYPRRIVDYHERRDYVLKQYEEINKFK